MKRNVLDWVALVLVVVGGINWGLVGLFDYNLVESLLGGLGDVVVQVVYILVGVAALYVAATAVMKKEN